MKWLSERDLAVGGDVRLFCLPHAGAGAAGYYRWKRLLPAWIAVCPVLLPGREGRLSEPALTSVAEVVAGAGAEMLEVAAERPYAIYGHSMGSLLAFELACAMPAPGPVALIVSGRNAPSETPMEKRVSRLSEPDFLRALEARYGVMAPGVMNDPELRALFLPGLRADIQLAETYPMRRSGAVLQCAVTALAGDTDTSVSNAGLAGWKAATTGSFSLWRLPGGHFFEPGEEQGALLRVIVEELKAPAA